MLGRVAPTDGGGAPTPPAAVAALTAAFWRARSRLRDGSTSREEAGLGGVQTLPGTHAAGRWRSAYGPAYGWPYEPQGTALAAWADFVTGKIDGNVVPIKRVAA
jgi:hypothetical protein